MGFRRLALSLLGPLLVGAGLGPGCHPVPSPAPHIVIPEDPGFPDFTTSTISSVAQLRQMAAAPPGDEIGPAITGTKFVVTNFGEPTRRQLHFLDGRYYLYHDEWAWFRLLNGQPVPGMTPLEPHPVETPAEARQWARSAPEELPEGLAIVEERLYVAEFYDQALREGDREIGAGALIHIPARPGVYPETWGFELEYSDKGGVRDVLVFFELLRAAVPEQVRDELKWITRSPAQAAVGKRMIASKPAFSKLVMSYDDISVPGETVVYTKGLVAGRLQLIRDLSQLSSADPDSILLLGAVPEYLPQARGVVTAIPQTPLSHLNLLAKTRGIINAYRGGVLDDPEVLNLVRSSTPVVVSAEDGGLRFRRISEVQYARWLGLERAAPPSPKPVSVERAPYVVDLSTVDPKTLDGLAPLIGGKAVGMVHLLRALGPSGELAGSRNSLHFDVPDRPMAITVRAYREHLAPMLPQVRALLADPNFLSSRKLRILALEGIDRFEQRFSSKKDRKVARSYLKERALGPIAAVAREGGLQRMIRKAPLPRSVEAELDGLRRHFSNYAPEQGLRFRSSSTVEDVEGSSGAGLYDSATGFFTGREEKPGSPKRPSLADALRKTWASYFSVEAIEERQEAGMDHLAGDMGVLVHARFDDEFEASNGVFTFAQQPSGGELLVDAQPGAVSVTNPPTDRVVRPESSRVVASGQDWSIDRVSLSSEAATGTTVLTDVELRELFTLAQRLTQAQIARSNAPLPEAQHRQSLVMDFEFRRVRQGWPALKQGKNPSRFVVKQMRPLEPNPAVHVDIAGGPIPKDVLARARRVERRVCDSNGLTLEALFVFTDPNALPDPGYSTQPLIAYVLAEKDGRASVFTHLDHRRARMTPSGFFVELEAGHFFSRIELERETLSTTRGVGDTTTNPVRCETTVEYAAPTELLRSFLEEPELR